MVVRDTEFEVLFPERLSQARKGGKVDMLDRKRRYLHFSFQKFNKTSPEHYRYLYEVARVGKCHHFFYTLR